MKLTSIRIEHFLGIRDVDVALKHPITIFGGANDVGKTSIQEAVRLAFTGEAVRVKHKKDYGALIRLGAKSGNAIVEFTHGGKSGRASAVFPSGKQECNPPPPPELPFILDAPRFAGLDETGRRRFLFDLFGVRANLQDVAERMLKKGCAEDVIKVVAPILRGGFDKGEAYAVEQLQHWRAMWKTITGEQYGEVKAESWRAPLTAAEVNRDEIQGIVSSITEMTEELRGITKEVGAAEAFLMQQERYAAEALGLKEKSQGLAKVKREVSETEKSLHKARTKAEQSKAKLAAARLSGQPCPSCGTLLAIKDGVKIIEIEEKRVTSVATAEAEAQADDTAARTLEQTLEALREKLTDAIEASSRLSELEKAMEAPTTPEKLQEIKTTEQSVAKDIAELTEKKRQLEAQADQAAQAKKTTAEAQQAHQKFKAWSLVREVLSPAGIPGEILEETLGPLNARLKASAELTGWPGAQLRGDMEIVVKDLPYALQGESVRWRVDAMLTEAIANASGLKLLVLDRIDILHPELRGGLLDWCFHLVESQGYESIILFGTLKSKPQIDGASVYWLEGGRIK